jgi:hypothetical protein
VLISKWNRKGWRALHFAAQWDHPHVVRYLAARGAMVDCPVSCGVGVYLKRSSGHVHGWPSRSDICVGGQIRIFTDIARSSMLTLYLCRTSTGVRLCTWPVVGTAVRPWRCSSRSALTPTLPTSKVTPDRILISADRVFHIH